MCPWLTSDVVFDSHLEMGFSNSNPTNIIVVSCNDTTADLTLARLDQLIGDAFAAQTAVNATVMTKFMECEEVSVTKIKHIN